MTTPSSIQRALTAAAEREDKEGTIELTQAELDRIHNYQSSLPTSPKPGFRYSVLMWRLPGDPTLWRGPHEQGVRWHIAATPDKPHQFYDGPLEEIWFVFECVQDDDPKYVKHVPKRVKLIT